MINYLKIRQDLNQLAELSSHEFKTLQYIKNYPAINSADSIIVNNNETALIAVYHSGKPGKNIAFRADIDALAYENGAKHLCGHDGHTTILLYLSDFLINKSDFSGTVILLFQNAEETGQGAVNLIKLIEQHEIKIDEIYGFHNLPAYPEKQIIINPQIFASASNGLLIKLKGVRSHASEPEKGINPASACASILTMLQNLSQSMHGLGFTLTTIVYCKIGEMNFGISPDNAQIAITLRAYRESDLHLLNCKAKENSQRIAEWHKLEIDFEEFEVFPSTKNSGFLCDKFKNVLQTNHYDYIEQVEPFRWSEDFGNYLKIYPGLFFGIGSGENHANLHNQDFDFNDKLIDFAGDLLKLIILQD